MPSGMSTNVGLITMGHFCVYKKKKKTKNLKFSEHFQEVCMSHYQISNNLNVKRCKLYVGRGYSSVGKVFVLHASGPGFDH